MNRAKTTVVRYKTTEAYGDANQAAIRAVFAELRERAPAGFRYASHRLADGVSFVHVATLAAPRTSQTSADGPHPLTSLPAFQTFQSRLRDNCVERPVVTELEAFDSYGDSLQGAGGQTS